MQEPSQPKTPWDLLPAVQPQPTWSERWRASGQMRLEKTGEITWRRHRLFLVMRLIGPVTYSSIGCAVAIAAAVVNGRHVFSLPWWPFTVLAVIIPAVLWAWWEYAAWGGDIYTLTDERIIDIERLPFGLKSKSNASQLENILDIEVNIPNILARLFNMGNVRIKTGATGGDLTFSGVSDPYGVQRDIFHRLAQLRRKQTEKERNQRFEEMMRWFKEYDNLPPRRSL